jgi:hypothetical protein
MVINHTVNVGFGRAGIRWYEFRKEAADWYIYQQGTYAPDDGENRWMGSIAMNANGDIALGYNISSADTYPSIFYVGRRADAPLGEMNLSEIKIMDGTGSQSGLERWGDYSCLSVDPVDDTTFWFTTEYMTSGWKTRIASFDFGPIQTPVVSVGNDTTICETMPYYAVAQASYQQSVMWHSSGDGVFTDSDNLETYYIRGYDDLDSGEVSLWIVANGYLEGLEASDTMNLYFSKEAEASAGPDTTICAGESVMLSGSAMYQDSVIWTTEGDGVFDDIAILNPVYTPGPGDISTGYAWLWLTAYDSIPCEESDFDKVKVIIDECTGISELGEGSLEINVVPNPVTSTLNFQVSGIQTGHDITLVLMDSQGVAVFTLNIPAASDQYSNSMNVSRFPKGLYYLKAGDKSQQVVQKVILQ